MANFEKYLPFLIQWEGSAYENVPGDAGGPTKYGITLQDWKTYGYDKNHDGLINAEDVKLISLEDAKPLIKGEYWDVLKADDIKSQSVAEAIVDFGYNAGRSNVARKVQKILNISKPDGIFGPITIAKINQTDSKTLFESIKQVRTQYYLDIVNDKPSQQKFLKGWLNRVNSLGFVS